MATEALETQTGYWHTAHVIVEEHSGEWSTWNKGKQQSHTSLEQAKLWFKHLDITDYTIDYL